MNLDPRSILVSLGNLEFHEPFVSGSHFPQCSASSLEGLLDEFYFSTWRWTCPEVDSPGLVRTWKTEHYFNEQLL